MKLLKVFVRIAIVISIIIPSVSSAHDFEVDGIYYVKNFSGTSVSVSYKGTSYSEYSGEYSGSVTIPPNVAYSGKNYDVTSIGQYAFYGCSDLTSLTIPNSVTEIGPYAFGECSGLTSVTIPNSVTKIGSRAFRYCGGLTSVTIGNSVTSIGEAAFHNCNRLTSVTIPNSVTEIGNYAFYGCSGLTSIIWNAKNCSDFSNYSHLFENVTGITAITFGNEVERIPAYLCYGLNGLTSITIPNSVTSIGIYAFSGCDGLTSVTWNAKNINDSSTDYAPFKNLSKIKSFNFGNEVKRIPACLCYGLSGLTSVTIPNSVTSIGNCAFSGCSGLTSATIGNSVTSIGGEAFSGCRGLTYVTIGNSVTEIGKGAFSSCQSLSSIIWNAKNCADFSSDSSYWPFKDLNGIKTFTFGDDVQKIPAYLCYGLNGLTSITIPNSVKLIGEYAFWSCSSLTKVEISDISDWCKISFVDSSSNPLLFAHHLYLNDTEITDLVIPNSVTSIRGYAFSGCSGLTSVTIPNSVTSIGNSAFQKCRGLKTVNWNAKNCSDFSYNTSTYSSTNFYPPFYQLTGITSFNFGNEVVRVPAYLCYGLSGLTSVTIGSSITSIGKSAFYGCSGLVKVDISNLAAWCSISFGEVSSNPLYYAKHLYLNGSEIKDLFIPTSVKEIFPYTFYGCSGLTSVTIPNSVSLIGDGAFGECSGLSTIIIGASVTEISSWAFSACHATDVFSLGKAPLTVSAKNYYVADKSQYSNYPSAISMIDWNKSSFNYIQELESISPINNVVGWDYQLLEVPTLHTEKGYHKEFYKFRFTKGNVSFDANIPFEYTINYLYKVIATTNDYSREYGEENPDFEVIYSGIDDYSLIETGAKATTTATKTSNVGEYDITLSGLKFKEDNYYIEYIPAKLTVTKAPLSIKIDDKERIYGDSNPSFSYTLDGLKNGETVPTWIVKPTLSTTATKTSPVGFYDITMNEPEAKNYDITAISNGKLSINKAMLFARANNASRLYFEDNPTFTCSYIGFKNNENSSVISKAPQIYTYANKTTKAGQYPIYINWAEAQNYDFTYVDGTININKRTIVATTPNYSRLYQEPNPQFEITYSGFVNNETINNFSMVPWVKCDAGYNANVGTYPIIIYNGAADNYNFDYRGGYLTVQKKEQTLTWDQDLSNVKLYSNLELTAKASSQLPVSYELDNNDIANIYTAGERVYVECFAEGTVIIRAQQMGNNNWYASSRITKQLKISRFGSVDDVYADTEKCYEVKGHDLVILSDGVELFDTNGRLIYAGAPTRLPLQTGIYIIRHNGKTFKELVK